jgi:hypothetical protein
MAEFDIGLKGISDMQFADSEQTLLIGGKEGLLQVWGLR